MTNCKNCKHWLSPSMGMYDDETWGSCIRHTDASCGNTKVLGLCEGVTNVTNRVKDFEFITHETFACNESIK